MSIGFGASAEDKKPEKKTRKSSEVLKPREKRYVSERVKGKSKRQAALSAGYSQSMANDAGRQIESKVNVKAAFQALIDRAIPDEIIIKRLAEGIDAKQTKFATFEGRISDSAECVDFDQRRKYLQLAAQWKGSVETGKGDTNVVVPIQIITSIPRPNRT